MLLDIIVILFLLSFAAISSFLMTAAVVATVVFVSALFGGLVVFSWKLVFGIWLISIIVKIIVEILF